MPVFSFSNQSPGPRNLEVVLRQSLARWGWRTVMWGIPLGWLATRAALGKFIFIAWIIYSLLTLAALLFGLKMARKLAEAGFAGGPPRGQARDFEGGVEDGTSIPSSTRATRRPPEGEGDIIDIEAEVLPPEGSDASRRG